MRKRFPRIAALHQDVPFGKFIPNALTLLGLCTGATAIRFALSGHWQAAVIAIVAAAVLDAMDGRIARLLGLESKFGAQLDSLADRLMYRLAYRHFADGEAVFRALWEREIRRLVGERPVTGHVGPDVVEALHRGPQRRGVLGFQLLDAAEAAFQRHRLGPFRRPGFDG